MSSIVILGCRSFVAFCLIVCFSPSAFSQVRVNEFLAKNETGLLDEDGENSDWIELFNTTLQPVDLLGWSLTDDSSDLTQWVFPGVTLGGGEFLVVFASNKDRAVPGSPLHTNFKLSTGGEYLALTRPDGSVATSFDPAFPLQSPDISYGLQADGVTEAFFDPPTPGAANSQGTILLPPVMITPERGVHSSGFPALLSHSVQGAEIHFTLDGSEPTLQSQLYLGPLAIRTTTTLRVRAFAAGFGPSETQTMSYILPADVVLQDAQTALNRGLPAQWIQRDGQPWTTDESGRADARPGAHYGFESSMLSNLSPAQVESKLRALPSLSIVMHPDDLFGYQSPSGRDGIYSNSVEDGFGWERVCSAEWMPVDGQPGFAIDCGLTIQGGSSTNVNKRGQLSMSLHFRSIFGPSKLNYKVFEDSHADEFDKLILDAHNQNSVNAFAYASLKAHAQEVRDPFMANLMGRMGHISPHSRYAHVYLNGMYWGVYAVHERPDDDFAAEHLGGDSEEYDYVKKGVVFEGNSNRIHETNPGVWSEIVALTRNPITPGSTWQGQDAWQALQDRVDMASYADYLLLNWYGGNTDWPHNNWTATAHARHSADFADVTARPQMKYHVWDAETTLLWGGASWSVADGFYDRTGRISNSQVDATMVHWAARHHPDWIMLFADRAHRLLSPGGALYVHPDDRAPGTPYDALHPNRNVPASIYDASASVLSEVVQFEFARWGNYGYAAGTHVYANWLIERSRLEDDYFAYRSGVLKQQLQGTTPRLYPTVLAPSINPRSGVVRDWDAISFRQSQGVHIYYTLDGSDPRASLGGISPTAIRLSGSGASTIGVSKATVVPVGAAPVSMGRWAQIRARAFDGSVWSPLEVRDYSVGMDLALNELMARNGSTLGDESGEFDDWFELLNRSDQPFDLTGFYCSDDEQNPRKWPVPQGTILAPGQYMIFWADGDEGQGPLHASFGLSGGGEFLGLFAPDGLGNVLVDGIDFPATQTDQSFGRSPDGVGPWSLLPSASPGFGN